MSESVSISDNIITEQITRFPSFSSPPLVAFHYVHQIPIPYLRKSDNCSIINSDHHSDRKRLVKYIKPKVEKFSMAFTSKHVNISCSKLKAIQYTLYRIKNIQSHFRIATTDRANLRHIATHDCTI